MRNGEIMKIQDILRRITERELPCVKEDSDIREVIKVAVRSPHTRLVYVVNDQDKLLGVITIGSLMRHLYPYHYEATLHPRDILRNIAVEKATHLMTGGNVHASPDDTVEAVLQRMASTGAKEMAVLDNNGCMLADITVMDLLKHYQLEKKRT